MAPTTSPTRNIDLAVMSVDPRRPWTAQALSANRALGAAFRVRRPVTVSQITVHVQTQSGNIDVGIYSGEPGTINRIASSGSVACPATGVQAIALTAPVVLVPGVRYWGVWCVDNSTAALYVVNLGVVSTAQKASFIAVQAPALPSTLSTASGTSAAPFLVFT